MSPRWTAAIAAFVLPALGIVDYIFSRIGGNDATFSAVILRCQTKFFYFAPCLGYMFGLFVGHCCFPSPKSVIPGSFELFARLFLACGPVLAGISLILGGEGETPGVDDFDPRWQLVLAISVLGCVAFGIGAGRLLLPQHPMTWSAQS